MIDVKANALRMLAEGMPRFMVAAKSGTTEAQISEWEQEAAQYPVLAMLHEGKTPTEIGAEIGCNEATARALITDAWRRDKAEHDARSLRRALERNRK